MDNSITVNRSALHDTIEANLGAHEQKVQEAQAKYRTKVIEELERRLADGRAGRPIDVSVLAHMPVPRSFAAEYRQALAELEWHTGDTVELTSRDFKRYVLDDWEWAPQWRASSSSYLDE
jgi:hypothetical protein